MKLDQNQIGLPNFISILSNEDRISYEKLQEEFRSKEYRYNRNQRFLALIEIFEKIRLYCKKDDIDEWKRYLVCGVCWCGEYLAINTKQLSKLISKCKSSINDALSKLGYFSISFKGKQSVLLTETIPILGQDQKELKKWSLRSRKMTINTDNYINRVIEKKSIEINKNIKDEYESEKYQEKKFFTDDYLEKLDNVKEEIEEEFEFHLNDNVDDNFDFNFGYNYGSLY